MKQTISAHQVLTRKLCCSLDQTQTYWTFEFFISLSLTTAIKELGMAVHLETSGAYPYSGNFDWVTFSPKQFKSPHPSIYQHVNEIKVVITGEYDLKWAEQQAALVSPKTLKYLQPEWNTPKSKELIFNYVRKNPQWRISLQTHKLLQVK